MTRFAGRLWFGVVLFAGVLSAFASSAHATRTAVPAASCSPKPYAYAGIFNAVPAQGIEAVITTVAASDVPSGHVAGWIGVGGPQAGPGGKPEWLQAGVNTQKGTGNELYVEIALPNRPIHYVTVDTNVIAGSSHRLSIAELAGKPDTWQVMVDGKAATLGIHLPRSDSFQPMAMTESWSGGTPTCNGYEYRFDQLQVKSNGAWNAMTNGSAISDLGYQVIDRTITGFTGLSA